MEELLTSFSGTITPWLLGTFVTLSLIALFAAVKNWREMKRSPYFFQRLQAGKRLQTYLYLITKNHSFTDGNKRIAAFLFLYFLERNGILFDINGNKRIADNTLVALTLMIAVSKPSEKDTMTKVTVNLINKKN